MYVPKSTHNVRFYLIKDLIVGIFFSLSITRAVVKRTNIPVSVSFVPINK